MQISQRFRTNAFSSAAVVGAIMLFCVAALLVAAVPRALAAPASDQYIVVLEDDVAHPANVAHRHEENRGAELGHIYGTAIQGYSAELTPDELKAIKQDPNVDYVEPDGVMQLDSEEPSTGMSRVFAVGNPNLDIDEVDDARIDADVAIFDDGVAPHPDLNVVSRTNCAVTGQSGCSSTNLANGLHATHVAGIAAALDNNFGVVGTAPGARIWSVQVFASDGALHMSDVIAAVNWVTARYSQIEVVNMSFHCVESCSPTALREAIAASVNKGVVYVAAAGNEGKNVDAAPQTIPAAFPDVITVSNLADSDGAPGGIGGSPWCIAGTDEDDSLRNISNYGAAVDIIAPGTCIESTVPGGGYATETGTSMAAPMVAGAAGDLAAAKNPNNRAEVEAIRNLLRNTGNYNWTDVNDGVKEPLLDMSIPAAPKLASATTSPASGLGTTTARLNGWVNPNGSATSYYFQYGKTSSYGSSIPASPSALGSGTGSLFVWNDISGLQSGTYHYRVVATNAAGTSYGADQTFMTLWGKEGQTPGSAVYRENIDGLFMFYPQANGVLGLEHKDSNLPGQWVFDQFPTTGVVGRTSAITRSNGDVMSFYRGTDSRIHVTWLNHHFNSWEITGGMTGLAAGPPSAVERNNGDMHVFYKGTDGVLHDLWYDDDVQVWEDRWMGGSPAGNPAVLNRSSNGDLHVFYRDTSGPIYDLWLSGTEWHNQYLGGAPVTDPKPLYRAGSGPGTGDIHVFYKATDGVFYDLWLGGSTWHNLPLGGAGGGAPAGNAAPLYRTLNGDLHAFYRGTSGYMYDWWMDANTNVWHESVIAGPIAGTASPINQTKTGDVHVFYVRPNGDLYDANLSGTTWKDEFIRAGAAVPTATE
jgi:subtilisin family serine protease